MAKVRVSELAKEYGITSKQALELLTDMGEFVKSASSGVEPPVVQKFKNAHGADLLAKKEAAEAKKAAKKAPAKKAAAKKAAAAPEGDAPVEAPAEVEADAPAAPKPGPALLPSLLSAGRHGRPVPRRCGA